MQYKNKNALWIKRVVFEDTENFFYDVCLLLYAHLKRTRKNSLSMVFWRRQKKYPTVAYEHFQNKKVNDVILHPSVRYEK